VDKIQFSPEGYLPTKAAVSMDSRRYYQLERGTCWVFSLIGFLEHSYLENGYTKNFLKRNEYLKLSEQGLGIRFVHACKKYPDVCNTPGDSVIYGSTSGGEMNWLYSFPSLFSEVLPYEACPYYGSSDDEYKCDNLQEKKRIIH